MGPGSLLSKLALQGVPALSEGAPADRATPGHKVSHSLGQQSGEAQPLRHSHNPPRREKQIGTERVLSLTSSVQVASQKSG